MKYLKKRVRPDYKIALMAIGISLFGLVMITSASAVVAYENFKGTNDYYYLWHQAIALIIGVVAMIAFSNLDYRYFKKISLHLLIGTIILLIMVFLPGIGSEAKGAHRWLNLGLFPLQPSEVAKVTFLIYLCAWLESRREHIERMERSLIPFLIMLGVIAGLIIMQPDLGTLTVIILSSIAVFFAAGAPIWQFGSLAAILGGVFAVFVISSPYRIKRLLTFVNPSSETLGRSYHINQAFIAVGQGGLWGLGFGNSIQKMRYLPEPHTDSIFAIICEELGFLRSSVVILAYLYFFYLGVKISRQATDIFGRLLAIGIISSIMIQAFINIAAMIGLVPLTGVTLPFISYGGSSLVISFIQVGILLSISRQNNAIVE